MIPLETLEILPPKSCRTVLPSCRRPGMGRPAPKTPWPPRTISSRQMGIILLSPHLPPPYDVDVFLIHWSNNQAQIWLKIHWPFSCKKIKKWANLSGWGYKLKCESPNRLKPLQEKPSGPEHFYFPKYQPSGGEVGPGPQFQYSWWHVPRKNPQLFTR